MYEYETFGTKIQNFFLCEQCLRCGVALLRCDVALLRCDVALLRCGVAKLRRSVAGRGGGGTFWPFGLAAARVPFAAAKGLVFAKNFLFAPFCDFFKKSLKISMKL